MEPNDTLTVTKIFVNGQQCYVLIRWQANSFEIFIYDKDKLWRGKFTTKRLTRFCTNLNMTLGDYICRLQHCLSQQVDDYKYEIESGFFYWKKIVNESLLIEGFLPIELDTSPKYTQPDLLEIMLALNTQLKYETIALKTKYNELKCNYKKCLKDTEDFLNLKITMEKNLGQKFIKMLNLQRHTMKEHNYSSKPENSTYQQNTSTPSY